MVRGPWSLQSEWAITGVNRSEAGPGDPFFWVPEGTIPWATILLRIPVSALMSAVLSVPLLSVFQRIDAEVQGEGGWTSLTSRVRS